MKIVVDAVGSQHDRADGQTAGHQASDHFGSFGDEELLGFVTPHDVTVGQSDVIGET